MLRISRQENRDDLLARDKSVGVSYTWNFISLYVELGICKPIKKCRWFTVYLLRYTTFLLYKNLLPDNVFIRV
jgi:hypothetical protein